MSRVYYSDDEEFPGEFNLQEANTNRSMRGKQGQAVLREMEAALVALPRKRLIQGAVACDGDVCAVGAVLAVRKATAEGVSVEEATARLGVELGERWEQEDDDTQQRGEDAGMPRLVAWRLVALNDVDFGDEYIGRAITPEQRYEKVLAWVQEHLRSDDGNGHTC